LDKKFDIIKPCGDKVGIGVDRAAWRVNARKIRANSAVSLWGVKNTFLYFTRHALTTGDHGKG
jgi:lipopolysaccharide assembly outer membrane protein LptD (OstA)